MKKQEKIQEIQYSATEIVNLIPLRRHRTQGVLLVMYGEGIKKTYAEWEKIITQIGDRD